MSTLSANYVATPAAVERRGPSFLHTPKGQVLVVFAALLGIAALGEPRATWPTVLVHIAVAALAAMLFEWPYLRIETGTWRTAPTSGLLTGLIVAAIVTPGTSLDIVAAASIVSILSKEVLRLNRNHLFNPAVIGLLWVGIQFGTGESWWGALGNLPLWVAPVLLVGGAYVVGRLNKWPTVLTFLLANFGLWTAASFINPDTAVELFRPPFVQCALFLAFFMLTDPPTSPNRYREQVVYALIAAGGSFVAMQLGAGQLYLLVGTVAANVWLAAARLWQRRVAKGTGPRRGAESRPAAGCQQPLQLSRAVATPRQAA